MVNESLFDTSKCSCRNGAGCSSFNGEMRCFCLSGFTGEHCELSLPLSDEETIIIILIGFLLATLVVIALNQLYKIYLRRDDTMTLSSSNRRRHNSIPSFVRYSVSSFRQSFDNFRRSTLDESDRDPLNIYEEIFMQGSCYNDEGDYEVPSQVGKF
ncbi:hypothetical protein TrispH2_004763 [Trichoplax sp. H2]|nr:hypothetical protein TrispH2_004763 [Trichoplax sp. H2]|eukprot:RDD42783.1 hypothetical protein TrispH2_004763 [Trichoplax sp. H2]